MTQSSAMNTSLYAGLMNEARLRIQFSEAVLESDLPDRLAEEFCYLQLRLLCEVIALACLVAHGDIRTKKMLRESKLIVIFKELERLHADFYPNAVIASVTPEGGLHLDQRPQP